MKIQKDDEMLVAIARELISNEVEQFRQMMTNFMNKYKIPSDAKLRITNGEQSIDITADQLFKCLLEWTVDEYALEITLIGMGRM